jgi:hypothetical protein
MRRQVETWQRCELTDVTAKVVIMRRSSKENWKPRDILHARVHDLYFEPKYETVGLSNAFTSAFKELDPIPHFRAMAKLGKSLEARFSKALTKCGGAGRTADLLLSRFSR